MPTFAAVNHIKMDTNMKKVMIPMLLCSLLMMNSCSSYTATGASMGGQFGHVIGSAVGGITGGWRGQNMGSLIGTVGGIVAGAAVGAAVENAQQRKMERMEQGPDGDWDTPQQEPVYNEPVQPQRSNGVNRDGAMHTMKVGSNGVKMLAPIEVRNAVVIDGNHDGVLTRGEACTVMFEIMNNTAQEQRDIYPLVEDVTGNKHITVSPNLRVESIAPNHGVRYTATIMADGKLKDGEIVIRVGVAQGQTILNSQLQEITVPTRKKAVQ